jgi:hypothetical protein
VSWRRQLKPDLVEELFLPGRKLKSSKGDTYIPGRILREADAA